MKKFLLTLFVMLFTANFANATTSVYYGNTGHPTRITYGAGHSVSAGGPGKQIYTPGAHTRRPVAARRYVNGNPNSMRYGNLAGRPGNVAAYAPQHHEPAISRFDRNYRVTPSKPAYIKNGVVYYN